MRACSIAAASARHADSAGIGAGEQRVRTSSVVTETCSGQALAEEVSLRSWTTGIGQQRLLVPSAYAVATKWPNLVARMQ